MLGQERGSSVAREMTTNKMGTKYAQKRAYDLQATWVIAISGLYFDMLSVGVCAARHSQTSARLV